MLACMSWLKLSSSDRGPGSACPLLADLLLFRRRCIARKHMHVRPHHEKHESATKREGRAKMPTGRQTAESVRGRGDYGRLHARTQGQGLRQPKPEGSTKHACDGETLALKTLRVGTAMDNERTNETQRRESIAEGFYVCGRSLSKEVLGTFTRVPPPHPTPLNLKIVSPALAFTSTHR